MKKLFLFGGVLSFSLLFSCGGGETENWNDNQKKAVNERCLTMLAAGNSSTDGTVENFCDCLTDKTVENYTPSEAEGLTDNDYKKLLEDCSYSW